MDGIPPFTNVANGELMEHCIEANSLHKSHFLRTIYVSRRQFPLFARECTRRTVVL